MRLQDLWTVGYGRLTLLGDIVCVCMLGSLGSNVLCLAASSSSELSSFCRSNTSCKYFPYGHCLLQLRTLSVSPYHVCCSFNTRQRRRHVREVLSSLALLTQCLLFILNFRRPIRFFRRALLVVHMKKMEIETFNFTLYFGMSSQLIRNFALNKTPSCFARERALQL